MGASVRAIRSPRPAQPTPCAQSPKKRCSSCGSVILAAAPSGTGEGDGSITPARGSRESRGSTLGGRVTTAAGQSVALELRPSGAAPTAGSHLSLAAMRALGLPLGQLATIRVFAD